MRKNIINIGTVIILFLGLWTTNSHAQEEGIGNRYLDKYLVLAAEKNPKVRSLFTEYLAALEKVVEVDDEKWAVFKDETGQVHCQSAVCPHMDCIVDWNDAEKSWDCPCHGSRFKAKGEFIAGPAFFAPRQKEYLN